MSSNLMFKKDRKLLDYIRPNFQELGIAFYLSSYSVLAVGCSRSTENAGNVRGACRIGKQIMLGAQSFQPNGISFPCIRIERLCKRPVDMQP
jgi:hypothetical protein